MKQRLWYVLFCLWDGALKKTLMLIGKSSSYSGGSGFPLSLSEWSFTMCSTSCNCKLKKCVECIVK